MVVVIPSINCPNFSEAERQIRLAESFLPESDGWIHIDVSDGNFSDHTSWRSPEEFGTLNTSLHAEVHLMVNSPEKHAEEWLKVGARRIIVHIQSVRDMHGLQELCKKYGAELMLSVDPTQPVDRLTPYKNSFTHFQILSVLPGASGQNQDSDVPEKISALKESIPTGIIEVDGGVSIDNASALVSAGANILVSGHAIFGSPDPAYSYKKLTENI